MWNKIKFIKMNALKFLVVFSALPFFAESKEIKNAAPVEAHVFSDTAVAVFASRHSLVLDVSSPLVHYYTASTSALSFSTSDEAATFFNNISDNLLSYEFNFSTSTVVVNIHLQYADPGWTVTDWNKYINSKLNP
jgi:hypothetical protein